MLLITLADVVHTLSGRFTDAAAGPPPLNRPFPRVSIDSRTLQPGQAYFALRGERHDGHAFVPEAARRGAAMAVVEHPVESLSLPPGFLQLRVGDTTRALQELGECVRKRWGGPLLAITGSMGKTTTRHFTAGLLSSRFSVHQTSGNLNNHIGLPLSLLDLDSHHDISVVELGMNHPGEIRRLSRICRPDFALITNVAPVHMAFFSGLAEIAEAKAEILEYLKPGGSFFFNTDDPLVRPLAGRGGFAPVSFGFAPEASYRVKTFQFTRLDSMDVTLGAGSRTITGRVPFCGKHLLWNLVAAAAFALELGVPHEALRLGMAQLQPLNMRGRPVEFAGITFLDDSYNSNPQAVQSLLETVSLVTGYTRKILVLGDMLELGGQSAHFHRQVGEAAARCRADQLITVGPDSVHTHRQAVLEGHPVERAIHFNECREASEFLEAHLKAGDLVFIKGSRGMHMDSILEALREAKS